MVAKIVEGLNELEASLVKLEISTAQKALKNALMYSAKPMVDEMKATAPYDSQDSNQDRKHLRDTIKRKTKKHSDKYSAEVGVGVFSNSLMHIAYFLEYGTENIAPNPWMGRAADKNVDVIINRFKTKLQKNIAKANEK